MGQRERVTPNLSALNDFLRDNKNSGFQWHTNDCLIFTNKAWEVMYGFKWAEDWMGRYTDKGLYLRENDLRRVFGYDTLEEAVADKLDRSEYPVRGSLVMTDHLLFAYLPKAFGISIGTKAVFLGKSKLQYLPLKYVTDAWVNK